MLFPLIFIQEQIRFLAIQNWPQPTSRQELQMFFDALHRYRRYVDWKGEISTTLCTLLPEGEVFTWTPLHDWEFTDLKKLAKQQPIPHQPLELLSYHASASLADESDSDMSSPEPSSLAKKPLRKSWGTCFEMLAFLIRDNSDP